jgi:carbonic anhydrase
MTEKNLASKNIAGLLDANDAFAKTFDQYDLPAVPSKQFAIVTCMDARMDPSAFAGLAAGDAHVIRNAGGRATEDAIRSLVISHKFLGTTEWFVIQHTHCGMATVTDEEIGALLEQDLETAVLDGERWSNPQRDSSENTKPGSDLGKCLSWYTIDDLRESVVGDVKLIQDHQLVPSHIKVHGFIYDVKTGLLVPVAP